MRIVSLLPSATEALFAIGAGGDVVGVTFECDFPDEARTRRIVSNTALPTGLTPAEIDAEVRARMAAGEDLYRLDEGALRDIEPDLIVTQDLCAVCAVDVQNVEGALDHLGCRAEVLTLDPMTLTEIVESMRTLGAATGHEHEASALVDDLRRRLDAVASAVSARPAPRIAVLEWTDPPFSAGHWVPDMVVASGAVNALGDAGQRSREVAWSEVRDAAPDVIVVAPCGFRLDGASDLTEVLVDRGDLPADVPVWAIDADAVVVRPGPRVVEGVEVLARIAHPDLGSPPGNRARRVRA